MKVIIPGLGCNFSDQMYAQSQPIIQLKECSIDLARYFAWKHWCQTDRKRKVKK